MSFSFQVRISTTAHAALDTEQLTSQMTIVMGGDCYLLQVSDGHVISFSEVLTLFNKIYEFLDEAVT